MMERAIKPDKHIIYVTGLPRSGSTLMCQALGHHPQVYSPGHSSPLSNTLERLRYGLSDDTFLLSQLDVDFDRVYNRLLNAFTGFINGWFAETNKPVVVDKNRGWLRMIDTVNLLDPDFRMIVTIRDPRQIFGSIESQHQKTLLLDFPDHMARNSVFVRADSLFANEGVVGGPMRSIEFLQDVEENLKKRLCYVTFEAFIEKPEATMQAIYKWLGLPTVPFDSQKMMVKPHESDSYYRFKYRHHTFPTIRSLKKHVIPPRIEREVVRKYTWFYKQFYPEVLPKKTPADAGIKEEGPKFREGDTHPLNESPPK